MSDSIATSSRPCCLSRCHSSSIYATMLMLLLLVQIGQVPGSTSDDVNYVKSMSDKISFELLNLGNYVTGVEKCQKRFNHAEVKINDGKVLVNNIAKEIEIVLRSKVEAIRRVMDVAEESALRSATQEANGELPPDDHYEFKSAKNQTHFGTSDSEHFGGNVNLEFAAVHVPTTVYGRAKETLRAIRWSEELDQTFMDNYKKDPSLSWQYFGSSTGFMRQYPAMHWKPNGSDPHDPDLFDCRTRSWYIEAATSPKDVLILVDTSGSMTGMSKEIARHVVNNILDTLGNNDYVNIIKFSNITEHAVPCFGDSLVQANLANIRELKNGIAEMNTERIANFSMILTYAFELLEEFRDNRRGACCNQAIMLVTDGVPDNYKEIFQRYNWASNPDNPDMADMPVRIFTYLIGREVPDVRDSRWMACANRGYFVHLSTLAEVREQVLNYIAVMARPLVLNLTVHPTIWTPVYADIADPKITDWLWDKKERNDQKARYWIYKKNKRLGNLEHELEQFVKRIRKHPNLAGDMYKYRLMTSVSMPVFDRRENANITEQVLVKNAYWVEETREKSTTHFYSPHMTNGIVEILQTRIANLLGVAGTDVPIDEIVKLMQPFKLGVHGYAFIVTNNGYILTHPDLRPVFQGILKPAYNSVDMAEVELVEGDEISREFNELLLRFREDVIIQKSHSDAHMFTKHHYDNMRRVSKLKRKYDSAPIENTPFTVVVSLPLYQSDVTFYAHQQKDPRREPDNKTIPNLFKGKQWRIHPEWLYCKSYRRGSHKINTKSQKKQQNKQSNKYQTSPRNPYHFDNSHNFATPEEELKHFINKIVEPNFTWGSHSAEHIAQGGKRDESIDPRYCNRDLMLNLFFDADSTQWFTDPDEAKKPDEIKKGSFDWLMERLSSDEFRTRFGYILSFVSTRTGLTRWKDFPLIDESELNNYDPAPDHFSRLHPRAVDEIWYRRAVEQYYTQPESFVFSVPIDEDGATNNTLVTASRAVFVGNDSMKAPAAVVGFQLTHQGLQGFFQNITTCNNCPLNCAEDEIECFLVDNHGYILAAKEATKAGRFLGDVNGLVMLKLVETGVYEKITVFDYQAVCFRNTQETNDGSIFLTPFKTMAMVASWLYGQVTLTLAKTGFYSYDYAEAMAYAESEMELEKVTEPEEIPEDEATGDNRDKPAAEIKDDGIYDHFIRIRRTRPEPCDTKAELYLFRNITTSNQKYDNPTTGIAGCDHLKYIVQPVNLTNMILLIIDQRGCRDVLLKFQTDPTEITYTVNSSLACQKTIADLPRRRPPVCIRSHPKESEIKDLCGRAANNSRLDLRLFAFTALLIFSFLGLANH